MRTALSHIIFTYSFHQVFHLSWFGNIGHVLCDMGFAEAVEQGGISGRDSTLQQAGCRRYASCALRCGERTFHRSCASVLACGACSMRRARASFGFPRATGFLSYLCLMTSYEGSCGRFWCSMHVPGEGSDAGASAIKATPILGSPSVGRTPPAPSPTLLHYRVYFSPALLL